MEADLKEIARFAGLMAIAPGLVQKETAKGINTAAYIIQRPTQRETPYYTGDLRRSWVVDKATPANFKATLGTNKPYAPAVEFGRTPGAAMPPAGMLLPWMKKKGIAPELEFLIRRKISRNPKPGVFMLRNAIAATRGEREAAFRAIPANVVKALREGKR